MLNCKEVTELASKRLDSDISSWQKLGMELHLLVCRNCRIYFKQLQFLQAAAKAMLDTANGPALSAQSRQRIAEKLRMAGKKTD